MTDVQAERYYDYTIVSSTAVSPDGERVAFVATEFDELEDDRRASLFVAPADGSADPHRLTRASDGSNPAWSPNGEKLAFLAARDEDSELAVEREHDEDDENDDEDGPVGEGPKPQVWVFDLSRGGDARQVTDRDYGVADFDWGPNGDWLVIAAEDPTEEDEEYRRQLDEDVPIEVSRLQHKTNEDGWMDDDRLSLTGFSYGGITTAATDTKSDVFAAAAAEHGIYDFYSAFGTDDNHRWHEAEFGLPWETVDTSRDISAITDVGDVDTPLLVTAGDEDWRCPPTQAEQLYVSVKKQGVDAKLVIYQDEHHNIGDPDRAIHRLETLADWFETH